MTATTRAKTLGSMLLALTALMTTVPAKAQTVPHTQITLSQQTQNYTVLHVNAATGSDQRGAGSAEQPYQTITQALQMAPVTSTVILLAPGHYSSASGEQFPLRLRPGITIQGSAGATRNTIIVGSGEFRDGSTEQNTAIVTSDRSGLANITVSNPKGSGVWISEGAPILRRVALVANAVAGVQVTAGAPLIENSYFHQNPNGLAIQGNSRATVRENLFEATGRAITVASPATPTINNNRIARNDVGIALKNNARPVLNANILNGNQRNGVVEVEPVAAETATVEVIAPEPVALEPVALEPRATGQEIPAVLTRPESVAAAVKAPAVPDQTETAETAETAETNETVLDEAADEAAGGAISDIVAFRQHLASSSGSAPVAAVTQPPILQRQQAASASTADDSGLEVSQTDFDAPLSIEESEEGVPIAVIPVEETEPSLDQEVQTRESGREGVSKLLARLQQPAAAVSPTAAPPADHVTPPADLVAVSSQRLPVPSATIPSGGGSGNLTPPGTVSLVRTFRYRVLVDMADADDLHSLVPDAFRTRVGGRMFMQAGAYADEAEAQERLTWLRENGVESKIDLRE